MADDDIERVADAAATGPCFCDGRYEGCTHGRRCTAPGGGRWSPYFCADCDPRRMAHIGASLASIKADLAAKQQG